MTNAELSSHFFLQLAIILAVCRFVGLAAKRIGQPQVVGEIIAGVLLGPSLFGLALPGLHSQVFPKASLSLIYVVGQVGVALYMFITGLELQWALVRTHARSATAVSTAGMAVPFALGLGLGYFLFQDHRFFSSHASLFQAMIFTAAALSITAFPTMARIIQEQGLRGTNLGALCLTAGCVNDALAWCAFAVVLATLAGTSTAAILTVVGGLVYLLVTMTSVRPVLQRVSKAAERRGSVDAASLAFLLALLMVAAWLTEVIGIHAVFGAFILGAAMPRGILSREIQRLLEPLTIMLLLPLYFVYSGLNTQLGLVTGSGLVLITVVIVAVACLGKGLACWAAARLNGLASSDATVIGGLMNARGLMELILLNLALAAGLITPTLFTMFALMAIFTTFAASPIARAARRRSDLRSIDGLVEPAAHAG